MTDWTPFNNRLEFETAKFLFKRAKISAANIDMLCTLWAASLDEFDADPPFASHHDLYSKIDAIPVGSVPWQSATFKYDGPRPQADGVEIPKWMENEYEIWLRDPQLLFKNMLANQDFNGSFDYAPFRQFDNKGNRRYEHLMSGDWAWKEAVSAHLVFHWCSLKHALKDNISNNPATHGALFVPIIFGSDKNTVSVATGHIEYWPLYASIGNIHNNMRRAHGSGLVLVGFLSIPKS